MDENNLVQKATLDLLKNHFPIVWYDCDKKIDNLIDDEVDDDDDNVVNTIRKESITTNTTGNESFDVYDDSDTDLAKLDTLINENDIFIETNLIDDENYMAEEIYIDEQNISDVEIPKIYEYIKTTEIKHYL